MNGGDEVRYRGGGLETSGEGRETSKLTGNPRWIMTAGSLSPTATTMVAMFGGGGGGGCFSCVAQEGL